jgi:hypothetical protein
LEFFYPITISSGRAAGYLRLSASSGRWEAVKFHAIPRSALLAAGAGTMEKMESPEIIRRVRTVAFPEKMSIGKLRAPALLDLSHRMISLREQTIFRSLVRRILPLE